jgi:farnesyl diphosphate synthase
VSAGDLLSAVMPAVADSAERELEHLLDSLGEAPPRLLDAMRHACLGGGKRFRPLLVAAAGNLFDAEAAAVRRAGAAVELLHCYSLVHDDLPAMDDADLRAGGRAATRRSGRPRRSSPATRSRRSPSRPWPAPTGRRPGAARA